MKVIGLTGGIGSGKSTVARVFESLGIPVFYADQCGREVLDADPEVRRKVIDLLGADSYRQSGANRKYIADRVFEDDGLLQSLNAIVHPAVGRAFVTWKNALLTTTDYCIREAAILFESGSHKDCDQVICVVTDDELRISRVIDRDRVSRAEVEARMAKQMPQAEKSERSDFVIDNSGNHSVIHQVMAIHANLMQA
jgi:dephospho-CoA kinase